MVCGTWSTKVRILSASLRVSIILSLPLLNRVASSSHLRSCFSLDLIVAMDAIFPSAVGMLPSQYFGVNSVLVEYSLTSFESLSDKFALLEVSPVKSTCLGGPAGSRVANLFTFFWVFVVGLLDGADLADETGIDLDLLASFLLSGLTEGGSKRDSTDADKMDELDAVAFVGMM